MIYDVDPVCSLFSMHSYLEFSLPFLPHFTHLSNFY